MPNNTTDTALFNDSCATSPGVNTDPAPFAIILQSNFAHTVALATRTMTISGTVADFRGGTFSVTTGKIFFTGASAQTFYPKNGTNMGTLVQNGAGGTTVSTSGFRCDSLRLESGTLNLGTGLSDTVLSSLNLKTGTLDFQSSTLALASPAPNFNSLTTLTAGTGTIRFYAGSGTQVFTPKSGSTHPHVTHTGAGTLQLASNDLTCLSFSQTAGVLDFNSRNITTTSSGNFSITNGTTTSITNLAGRTITVAGTTTLNGQNGNLLNLDPASGWTIASTGALTADYATIKNSNASVSGGTATNSTNGGSNTNWSFGATIVWNGGGTDGTCGGGAGDGNKWVCSANWDLGRAPISGDSVVFNGTSTKNCKLDADKEVRSIVFTSDYTGTFDFQSYALTLNTSTGDFRSGGSFTPGTGKIAFTGSSAKILIPKSGGTLPTIEQNGTGGTTVTTNGLTAVGLTLANLASNGAFNLGAGLSHTITTTLTLNTNGNLNFGSSTLAFGGTTADFSSLSTLTPGTGTLQFTSGSAVTFTPKSGATHPGITLSGAGTVTVSTNGLSAGTLTLSAGAWDWGSGLTHTVSGLSLSNSPTMTFGSSTVQLSAGNFNFSQLGTLNANTGTVSFTATSGNQTLTPKASTTHPNVTKTGAGGTLTLATNALTTGTLTVSSGVLDLGASSLTHAATSVATAGGTLTFGSNTLQVTSGNCDLSGLATLNANTGTLAFTATSGTQTFTPKSGSTHPDVTKSGAGTVALATNGLTGGALTVSGGVWDWGSGLTHAITGISLSNSPTMTFESSLVSLSAGNFDFSQLGTLNANTGTIRFTASSGTQVLTPKSGTTHPHVSHTGAGTLQLATNGLTCLSFTQTAGTLDFNSQNLTTTSGGAFTVTGGGSTSFANLGGRTLTVAGATSLNGQNGNLLNLNPGSAWTIASTGDLTATYANVMNSTASVSEGSASGSIDGGGNVNWVFAAGHNGFVLDAFTSDELDPAWTFQDADNDGGTGSYSLTTNADQLTLSGRGSDVWGATNEYVALYRGDFTGNFDAVVKVASLSNGDATGGMGGLMLADDFTSLASGGYAKVLWRRNGEVEFAVDASGNAGELETAATTAAVSGPVWLRLVKRGTSVTAFYKNALANPWIQVGTAQTPQSTAPNSQVGIFASARTAATTLTAVFDDFEIHNTHAEWDYSTRIFFNTTGGNGGARVTGSVTNFPMLVRLDANNFLFSQARSDGSDIRFEDPDGTMLEYEIERWDATNKLAEIWVRVPQVDGNSSADFVTLHWGNNSASARSAPGAVFRDADGFKAVWHLYNGGFSDATANGNTVTNSGTADKSQSIIAGGRTFDGSDDEMTLTDNSSIDILSAPLSVSVWINPSSWSGTDGSNPNNRRVISKGTGEVYGFKEKTDVDSLEWALSGPGTVRIPDPNVNQWHHLVGTYDGSTTRFYLNGVLQVSAAASGAIGNSDDLAIGNKSGSTASRDHFLGHMDEIRIAATTHSADFIKLSYETQKQNPTCITIPGMDLSTWSHATKLYINTTASGANVSADVGDFALLVRLHAGNFNFSQARSDGGDLRFADSTGAMLPYEIERFDAANKVAEVWVKIPTVKGNNKSQWFRMYWGKPDASSLSSGPAVFTGSPNYIAAWHLGGNLNGSTAAGWNLTNSGATAGTGVVGQGYDFNNNASAATASAITHTSQGAVAFWMKADACATTDRPMGSDNNFEVRLDASCVLYPDFWNSGPPTTTLATGTWYHVVGTWEQSSSTIRLYVNGALATSGTVTIASPGGSDIFTLGTRTGTTDYYDGMLDEVQWISTLPSASWVKLTYETQKTGSNAVSFGGQSRDFAHSLRLNFNTTSSGADVSGNVTNIPILVRLNSANFTFSATTATGSDIQFVDKGGAYLYHEVVEWDKGNETGKVWVRVPQVDGNSTTDYITLYYGCSACTGSPYAVKDSVWSEYKSVFHLNAPEDKAYDAALLGNHGSYYKNVANDSGIVTRMAAVFDGASDYVSLPTESNYDILTNLSVWAWIQVNAFDKETQAIVTKGNTSWRLNRSASTNFVEFSGTKSSTAYTSVGDDNVTATGSNNGWHHVVGTYDGTNIKLYVNGAQDGSSAAVAGGGSLDNTAHQVYIGEDAQTTGRQWRGNLSEVRIGNSANALSADYIKLSYENQKKNSLLFSNITTASFQRSRQYRFNTTASGANISSDVNDFPLLLRITGPVVDSVEDNAPDIRFLDADGVTWLPYSIERWSKSLDSAEVWVKVPKIDGNSGGDFITWYYRQASGVTVPDAQCATCVFDGNNVKAAYHLNDNAASATVAEARGSYTGTLKDNGSNQNTSTRAAAPYIGSGSMDFDGANDRIDLGSSSSIVQNAPGVTLSAWINADVLGTNKRSVVFLNKNQSGGFARSKLYFDASSYQGGGGRSADAEDNKEVVASSVTQGTGAWTHVAAIIDYAADAVRLYKNGVRLAASPNPAGFTAGATSNTASSETGIGNSDDHAEDFDGRIDEVWISAVAHDTNWVKLAYQTQRRDASPLFNPSAADFAASRKYTFNTTKTGANVMGDVENYPLLVRITGSAIVDAVQNDYDDIRFLDGDGKTWLNYHVERWNKDADSAEVWVLVPRVDGNSNTDHITLYYGEKTANSVSDAQCVSCVFGSMRAVYPMNENAADNVVSDLTGSYNAALKKTGGTSRNTSSYTSIGNIGTGLSFDGDSSWLHIGSNLSIFQNVPAATVSAWIKGNSFYKASSNSNPVVFISRNASLTTSRVKLHVDSLGYVVGSGRALDGGGQVLWICTDNSIDTGAWHHVGTVLDFANDSIRTYVNGNRCSGTKSGPFGATSTPNTTSDRAAIGSRPDGSNPGAETFNGLIDNVQMMITSQSDDWFKLNYETQRRTGNVFWNARPGPNNRTTLTAAPGNGAISLSWTLPVSDSSNADSVGIWVKNSAPPDSANATSTTFVVKLPITDSTYSYPAVYPTTYYFGLAVRNTSGEWSPITAASTDTVSQGGYTSTDTVYVDSASGDDGRSCATANNPATPKLTIGSAVTNCASGANDTLVIRVFPGTYTGTSFDSQEGDPVVIASFDNNSRAILNGSGNRDDDAVTYYYTVALGDDITLRNMDVKAGTDGYNGIYLIDNTLRIVIDGCRIYNNGNTKHLNGIYIRDNANEDVLIKNSAIVEPTQYGIYATADNDFAVVHNVFHGSGGSTKGIYMPNSSGDLTTITITNNIFVNWDYGIHTTDADNNIGKVDNNLFHLVTTGQEVSGETDAAKVVKDPLFAFTTPNAPNAFKLLPGSPAIDAGTSSMNTSSWGAYPRQDMYGTSRPQGSAPDIGLYEGSGHSSSPTVEFDTLTVTAGTDTIAVKNGKWKVVFDKARGGGIARFYDMVTDSTAATGNLLAANTLLFDANIDGTVASAQNTFAPLLFEKTKTMALIRQRIGINFSWDLNVYYTLYASGHIFIQCELVNIYPGSRNLGTVSYTAKVATAATAYSSNQGKTGVSHKNGFGYLTSTRDVLLTVTRDLDAGASASETWTQTATSGASGNVVFSTSDLASIPQNMLRQHHFLLYIGDKDLTQGKALAQNADSYVPAAPVMTAGSLLHERSWQDNLVAHWTLDDGGGDTAKDKSVNYHNNALVTGAKFVPGKVKGALQFTDADVAVVADNAIHEARTDGAIMFWVKPNWTSMGSAAYILTKGTSASDGWFFQRVSGENKIRFTMGSNSVTTPVLAETTWTHIAAVFRNTAMLYVDGVPVDATTSSLTATANASAVRMGENTGAASAKFVGHLDDVRIYSSHVNGHEVQAVAARGFKHRYGYYQLRADNNNRVVAILDEGAGGMRIQPSFRVDNWWAGATPKFVYLNGVQLKPNVDFVSSLTSYPPDLGKYLRIQINRILAGSATLFIDDDDSTGYLGDAAKMKSLTISAITGNKIAIKNTDESVFGDASSGEWYFELDLDGGTDYGTGRVTDTGFGEINVWRAAAVSPNVAISSAMQLVGQDNNQGKSLAGMTHEGLTLNSAAQGYAGPATLGYTVVDSSSTRFSVVLDAISLNNGSLTATLTKRWTIYPTGRIIGSYKITTPSGNLTGPAVDFNARYNSSPTANWDDTHADTAARYGWYGGDLDFHSLVGGVLSVKNQTSTYKADAATSSATTQTDNASGTDYSKARVSLNASAFTSANAPITTNFAIDISRDFTLPATADSLLIDLQRPAAITALAGTANPDDTLDFGPTNDGFAEGDGAYVYQASDGGIAHFQFANSVTHFYPAFRIKEWSFGTLPDFVIVNNQQLVHQYHYNAYLNTKRRELVLQFNRKFAPGTHVFYISHKTGLAVSLNSLAAVGDKGGNAIHWATESEFQNLGYHIWRRQVPMPADTAGPLSDTADTAALAGRTFTAEQLEKGGYVRINFKLIPGAPDGRSSSRRTYSFLDREAKVGAAYEYYVQAIDFDGLSQFYGPVTASPENDLETALYGNFPNPFNPVTFIRFSLREELAVSLVIYDLRGRVVKTLLRPDKPLKPGRYRVTWDATNNLGQVMATGPYFYRFQAGRYIKTKKMILLK